MSIITNKDGDVLQEFIPVRQEIMLNSPAYIPLTHSLIVLKHTDKTLLVHDIYKNRWEIPGGKIEPGETPRMCILRELEEETGQTVTNLQIAGITQVFIKERNRVVFGALFTGQQDEIRQFKENNEVSAIIYWDGHSDIGYIDEIDKKLTELVCSVNQS